jgi:hypothetical protein
MKTVGDEIDEAGVTTGAHTLIEAGQAPTSKGEQREGVASNGVSPLTRAIETMGPAARMPPHTRGCVHVGGEEEGEKGKKRLELHVGHSRSNRGGPGVHQAGRTKREKRNVDPKWRIRGEGPTFC